MNVQKLNKRFFPWIFFFTLYSNLIFAGTPHAVYGKVEYQDGTSPSSLSFSAYIITRPTEILTQNSSGCGYDPAASRWYVQCGNFATAWQAGDVLHVDMNDGQEKQGSIEVTLTYQPADQAPLIVLTRSSRLITITTVPDGLSYSVDGNTCTGRTSFSWEESSGHTLAAPATQSITQNTRYLFLSWSDGGAREHIYTVPGSNASLILSCDTQHHLTLQSAHGEATGDGWYDEGTSAAFSVTESRDDSPEVRYLFTGWTGLGNGSYSGALRSQSVVMNNPITEKANWKTQFYLSLSLSPPNAGIVEPGVPGAWSDSASVMTLHAIPDSAAGFSFNSWSGDKTGSENPTTVLIDRAKTIIARFKILDLAPPLLLNCYPPDGSVMIPKNRPVQVTLKDYGMGIDLSSLDLVVNAISVMSAGSDKTGGNVEIDTVSSGIRIIYRPATHFSENKSVQVDVRCLDLASPPNTLDSSYAFLTGNSHLVESAVQSVGPGGGMVIDHNTGVQLNIPALALEDLTDITIGVIDRPPPLPDSLSFSGKGYYFGPDGILFQDSVTVFLPFTQSDLENASVRRAEDLPVYHFTARDGRWHDMRPELSGQNYIKMKLREFCFVVFASVRYQNTDKESPSAPSHFGLMQNYPNPFNSSTIISFTVPEPVPVELTVHNIQGQIIRDLVMKVMPKGKHSVEWDGKDREGNTLGNGVYIIMLKSGSVIFYKKAVLVQ